MNSEWTVLNSAWTMLNSAWTVNPCEVTVHAQKKKKKKKKKAENVDAAKRQETRKPNTHIMSWKTITNKLHTTKTLPIVTYFSFSFFSPLADNWLNWPIIDHCWLILKWNFCTNQSLSYIISCMDSEFEFFLICDSQMS